MQNTNQGAVVIDRKAKYSLRIDLSTFEAPVRGFPSDYCHNIWYGKTRMVWLPDVENISKISLFVLTECTNMTDGRTDGHCMMAKAALYASGGKNVNGLF